MLALLDERRPVADEEEPEWAGTPLLQSLINKRDSLGPEQKIELEGRISGLEAAREEHSRGRRDASACWDASRWPAMNLEERRAAVGTVLRSVTVLPLPPGRSRRAPFDPTLLRVTAVT
ncbi:hypothetical protein AQJ23_31790 [Streptomyces antibioticus]|nr:hypothetical protein [Streptomyces antibioticus]KUN21500.1 hypothetical protein AQJ23_31790 [Streptomyces antibioticus]